MNFVRPFLFFCLFVITKVKAQIFDNYESNEDSPEVFQSHYVEDRRSYHIDSSDSVELPSLHSVEFTSSNSDESPSNDLHEILSQDLDIILPNVSDEVICDDLNEIPSNGSDEVPSNGSDEIPSSGSDEIPSNGSDEIPSNGSDEIPSNGSDETPSNGSDEIPSNGSEEIPSTDSDELQSGETDLKQNPILVWIHKPNIVYKPKPRVTEPNSRRNETSNANVIRNLQERIAAVETSRTEDNLRFIEMQAFLRQEIIRLQTLITEKNEEHKNETEKILQPFLQKCALQCLSNDSHNNMVLPNEPGRSISRHEADKPWAQQDKGCGGVLVADKGKITFTNDRAYQNRSFECIWTIRANRRSNVNIRLTTDKLGKSFLALSQLTKFFEVKNSSISDNNTIILTSKNRRMYSLAGPVVFVSLVHNPIVTNSNSQPPTSFTLEFEGSDLENTTSEAKNRTVFTHYHIFENSGSIQYPENGRNYSSNEIVTFTVNPVIPNPMLVELNHVDIEDGYNCMFDSLVFRFQKFTKSRLLSNQMSRICGSRANTNILTPESSKGYTSLVTYFVSDSSFQGTGFKMSWRSPIGDSEKIKIFLLNIAASRDLLNNAQLEGRKS